MSLSDYIHIVWVSPIVENHTLVAYINGIWTQMHSCLISNHMNMLHIVLAKLDKNQGETYFINIKILVWDIL